MKQIFLFLLIICTNQLYSQSITEVITKKGDNLWSLAEEHLGSGFRYMEIWDGRTNYLYDDPNKIYPGMKFIFKTDKLTLNQTNKFNSIIINKLDSLYKMNSSINYYAYKILKEVKTTPGKTIKDIFFDKLFIVVLAGFLTATIIRSVYKDEGGSTS